MARIIVKKFTSSGTWTAPAGVTRVQVRAWGGGGGGSTGESLTIGGCGGAAAAETIRFLDVIPNTSYTITIGSGGTGGVAYGAAAGAGGNTTFGSLLTAYGAFSFDTIYTDGSTPAGVHTGFWAINSQFNYQGSPYYIYHCTSPYPAADPGTGPGPYFLAWGGTGGPGGAGGVGGDYSSEDTATNGASAAANTGAGGGGGGGTDTGSFGDGGNGGSGYCEVMWVE